MKSIKLRKVGLILAGIVFVMGMAFNFQYSLNGADQEDSSIALSELVKVAMAQSEENGPETYVEDFETYEDEEGCTWSYWYYDCMSTRSMGV